MEITCPRCGSRYHIDPPATSRTRSSRGLKFRCSNCSHTFGVDPVQVPAPAAVKAASRALEPAPRGGDNLSLVPMGEPIRLIQQQAQIFEVPDMGTIYRWILEHRISRTDLFSVHGMRWQAVGDRPDLERFFAAAEALRGRPQPTASRWDNMDVVPMEETPSTVEHLLHAPRGVLPDPASQSGIMPLEHRDRASNSGVRVERAPAGAMFGPPPEPPRRSPIEEQAVEIEMDSASEHGVVAGSPGAFGLSMGETSSNSVRVSEPGPRRVDVLPDAPDSGDVPSSFAMDPVSSAGDLGRSQEMSFGSPSLPESGFSDSEETGSAVAVDSASSAGLDLADDSVEAGFHSGTSMTEGPVSTNQLHPVGKARPPVIQLRPPRRRRDDLTDEETLEAPSSAGTQTAATLPEPVHTPPPPDPVFGPAPRVSITPNVAPPRRDIMEDESEEPRGTPAWVWAVAAVSVVVITVVAVLAWSTLNPPTQPVNAVQVNKPEPAAPVDAGTPAATPAPAIPATGPATPTPAPPPVETPKPAPKPPAPKPETPKPEAPKPPAPVRPTTPPPTSGKNLVRQAWSTVDKDPAKARDMFDRAVQANSGNAEAVYGRGYAEAKMGNTAAARSDLCQAQRLNKDPELAAEIQAGLRRVGGACN